MDNNLDPWVDYCFISHIRRGYPVPRFSTLHLGRPADKARGVILTPEVLEKITKIAKEKANENDS